MVLTQLLNKTLRCYMTKFIDLLKKYWVRIYFAIALIIVGFGYGIAVGKYQVFPYQVLNVAHDAGTQFWYWVELYLPKSKADHPHMILFPDGPDGKSHPEVISAPRDVYTLVSEYQKGGFAFNLYRDKEKVWAWRVPEDVWQQVEANNAWPMLRDHYLSNDVSFVPGGGGDLIILLDDHVLARIDKCSNTKWALYDQAHHGIDIGPDGDIWVPGRDYHTKPLARLPHMTPPFIEDTIMQVSPDGKLINEFSLLQSAYDAGFPGLVLAGNQDSPTNTDADPTHLNDIEILEESFTRYYDFFEAGDIMVSPRTTDAIWIIDRETEKVKWALDGLLVRQHDPDITDRGTIVVFDNRTAQGQHNEARYLDEPQAFGYSKIVEFDPVSQQIIWSFEGSREFPFYTSINGRIDVLDNGNVLVVESEGGRVFEIDYDTRQVIWQYVNQVDTTDEGRLFGRTTGGYRLNPEDVTFIQESCDAP